MTIAQPQPPVNSIRKARDSQLPAVADTLAAAFQDDPVISWVVPDPIRRRQIMPGFFELMAAASHEHDEVYTTADCDGAALWVPPDALDMPDEDTEAFAAEIVHATAEFSESMLELFEVLNEHHPHEGHYYLPVVGTRPEHQGRGIGSALLRPVLERCDAVGLPAYLEATSPRNIRLYERNGFEVTRELIVPDGPTLWAMRRAPAA
ncbi:MAG: GNAT family N-acetyltransferase [Actinobacteria bacterium]|nr:GNAT family N-acetyltransferase [Actinomycetota bacterium]